MSFDVLESSEIIETLENYLDRVRPEPEIRDQLDIGYTMEGQSIILLEIRPIWNKPGEIQNIPYAKASYIRSQRIWKIYWMRANLKWYGYDPTPSVKKLSTFLRIVDEDKLGCFKG